MSVALHAPGHDFQSTLDSIMYLRNCLPKSSLVRQFATFHIYFGTRFVPKYVPKSFEVLQADYDCTKLPPFINATSNMLFKSQRKLLYPINVGRNIARDAALTHFILVSDIELYPSFGLVDQFLDLVTQNYDYMQRKQPRLVSLLFYVDYTNLEFLSEAFFRSLYLKWQRMRQFHIVRESYRRSLRRA